MATTLNYRETILTFPKGRALVCVEEFKTLYKVTIKPVNYEMPVCLEWRVNKKGVCNMLHAVTIVYNDYAKDNTIIWNK